MCGVCLCAMALRHVITATGRVLWPCAMRRRLSTELRLPCRCRRLGLTAAPVPLLALRMSTMNKQHRTCRLDANDTNVATYIHRYNGRRLT